MSDESKGDLLYLVGHVAWRLVQAALVTGVVIGILVVMPRGPGGMEKAYIATMKSDLRNLAVAQEAHLPTRGQYAAALDQFNPPGMYQASRGVIVVIDEATATGWRATATHNNTKYRCALFIGSGAPPRQGAEQGTPVCWKP